jgi:hepatocyte growth factor-regulated tyrosine kinase substrate
VPRPSAPIETSRTEAPTFPAYGQPSYQASTPTPSAPGLPTLPNYDLDPLETDVILTYNQTIAQIDAQNRPDIVRYPAVTELHNRAGSLQPRFDRSLDDTERKERLLEEMNAKLSQAVRLYDSILTQQVARPAWRQQQQQQQQQPLAPSATYQQHTLTAYTPQQQWAAPSSPVPNVHPYATQPYAQSSSPVQTYMPFSPSSMTYQASAAPVSFTSGPQLPAVSAPTAPLSPAPIAAAPPPPPLRQDSYARAQVASPAPPVQQYAPQPQHAQPFQTLPPSQQTMPAFPNVPSYAPFPNVPAGTAYAPSPGVEKVEAKEVALIEL